MTPHSQTALATAGGLPKPKAGGKKSRLGPQAKAAAEAVDVQAGVAVLPSQVRLNLPCTRLLSTDQRASAIQDQPVNKYIQM